MEESLDNAQKFYIGNIPYEATEEELISFFAEQGVTVLKVDLVKDRETERPKGFGFGFVENDQVEKMKEVNGKEYNGRPLKIDLARPKEDRPREYRGGGGGNFGNRGYRSNNWNN